MTLEERVELLERQVQAGERQKRSRLLELDTQLATTMRLLAALRREREALQSDLNAGVAKTA